jgi:hypothetical protein
MAQGAEAPFRQNERQSAAADTHSKASRLAQTLSV